MGSFSEKRKHPRIGYDMPVEFSMNVMEFGTLNPVCFTGLCVDKSENGLGFITTYDLEPGIVIELKQGDGSVRRAEVRWVGELDGRLRVGVLLYNE